MRRMGQIWVESICVALVVVFLVLVDVPTRRHLAAEGNRFARDYRLWIAPAEVEAVNRAHRTDRHVRLSALAVGVATYAVARQFADALTVGWASFAVLAGVASVLRVRQAGRDFTPPAESRALARSQAVRLGDYLPVATLVVLGVCPVLALGAVAAGADALRRGVEDVQRAWFVLGAGSAIAALGLLLPVLSVALTRRPSPASDAPHLYLQDAWRAEQLRRMIQFEAVALAFLVSYAHGLLPVTGDAALWLLPLSLAPILAVGVTHAGRLHFRRTLWRDLAPEEWVQVGGTVNGATAR